MIKDLTISQLFFERCQKKPNKNSIGWIHNGELKFFTNEEYQQTVEKISLAIMSLGIMEQDKIAILSQSRKEWNFFDLGIMCSRLVSIPIYPSLVASECAYIINHSEAKGIIVENEIQFLKLIDQITKLTELKFIVSLEHVSQESLSRLPSTTSFFHYEEFLQLGSLEKKKSPKLFEDFIHRSSLSDTASIIYTSGTTGVPKGALITQRAFSSMFSNVYNSLKTHVGTNDRVLTFLPLSHVLGRTDSFLCLIFELENIYAESLEKMVDNLAIAKPTLLIAVPRIFEKVYAKVLEKVSKENLLKQQIFQWALHASEQYFQKINDDFAPSPLDIIQKNLAYKLVFEKVYQRFGGKIRFLISGGAPLSPHLISFLQIANLTVLEGYGLTETVAPITLNPPFKQIPGTIGLPLGDVQVSFNDDGEILIKTQSLFTEYYKDPEATQNTFQDGWFMTGDIGEVTPNGYIKITDRKKDIIITSAGKNVAPQKIENLLKLRNYISNAMVIGDQKKFLTVVICLDREAFIPLSQELGLSPEFSYEDLCQHSRVKELIAMEIEKVNADLPSFEKLKGYLISTTDFTVENGYLTPSLKLKKKFLLKNYEEAIEKLYAELEETREQSN